MKLQVDLGSDLSTGLRMTQQIVAGIGKFYQLADLIGKEIAIVANLEPRKLMELESQGMALCTSDENVLAFLTPEKSVAPGSEIK